MAPPLPRTRQDRLLREVELRGSVRASHLAEQLGVAEVTIRRDIIDLDRAGLLTRVHGGAVALTTRRPQAPGIRVGVVVPSSSVHFPLIVQGMQAAAPALHVRLVLGVSSFRPDIERRHVERLLTLGVDGIVLAPTVRGSTERDIAEWVSALPVPAVFLERRIEGVTALGELDSVRTDHAHGAALAVEHLARLGHTRVALAAFDRTPTAPAIRAGYHAAVHRVGLDPAPDVALPKGEDNPEALDGALAGLLDRCLATGTRAALVHTDSHASRLVEAALDRGLRIPEDLAVVAFDDDLAELAAVPLTAVTSPGRAIGEQALRLLLDRIAERDQPQPARHVQLVPHLTVRESCGARESG
jgi:DNA-binding LacI/PurR family transcriptional regulator